MATDTLESGYSSDRINLQWLEHFDHYSTLSQKWAYQLLLLDSYGFLCTYRFIEYCDNHNILSFCLPPHTTYLLRYSHWMLGVSSHTSTIMLRLLTQQLVWVVLSSTN